MDKVERPITKTSAQMLKEDRERLTVLDQKIAALSTSLFNECSQHSTPETGEFSCMVLPRGKHVIRFHMSGGRYTVDFKNQVNKLEEMQRERCALRTLIRQVEYQLALANEQGI